MFLKSIAQINQVAILALALAFSSCSEDSNNNSTPTPNASALVVKIIRNIQADTAVRNLQTGQVMGTGRFTLLNFETGNIIPNADSATTKWDIGFRGTTLMLNGGSSGPGMGGAAILAGAFDDIAQFNISNSLIMGADGAQTLQGFEQDSTAGKHPRAIPAASGAGWYLYNPGANLITPLPGRVFGIRTATGKFVKMEVISYYKNAPAAPNAMDPTRFYTIRYTYQPDGSGKVK